MKKTAALILLIIMIFSLLCACENKAPELAETGSIKITAGGEQLGEVSLSQIEALDSYKRTMTVHSSS